MYFVLVFALIHLAAATFSHDFSSFLIARKGRSFRDRLNRHDFGSGREGSFGGGSAIQKKLATERPVIFVHGATDSAVTMRAHRDYFIKRGYSPASLYATTYSKAWRDVIFDVPMKCAYVKQIRLFIKSVHAYTGKKVDILAYSMGSPIARKAILGGKCMDSKVLLGPPITHLVNTFVSVAGANNGANSCVVPVSGTCNAVNGLYCRSKFLLNINSKLHYEGQYVYTVRSNKDEMTGNACGKRGNIKASNADFVVRMNHKDTMHKTLSLQYDIISLHS